MPEIGQTISHYRIVDKIGQGGMGEVYQATDTKLGRDVAIKALPQEFAKDADRIARFQREAKLLASLNHPNIAAIHGLEEADGTNFLVMELIEGNTLADRIKSGPIPVEEALKLALQIAEALEAAHEKGIIHRDLKPANIMLTRKGHTKVMDFGLAKQSIPADQTESQAETLSAVTQNGAILGTLTYMSPEQMQGKPLGTGSDIFAFGIVLYEMLAGVHPFGRASSIETASAILKETPLPLDHYNPRVSKPLQDTVAKMLAKNPLERYRSIPEVLKDLEAGHVLSQVEMTAASPQTMVAPLPLQVETSCAPISRLKPTAFSWKWLAVSIAVVFMAVACYLLRDWLLPQAPLQQKPITVLVADFDNHTSESVFNGTLETVLNTAIEGAPFITAYQRSQARRIAERLQTSTTSLDERISRLVAQREGIEVILVGSISSEGYLYTISIRAVDAITGKLIEAQENKSVQRESIIPEMGKLVLPILSALGDATPESVQQAAYVTFTTANLDAAHLYSVGVELEGQGKSEESIRYYKSAIQIDPKFADAYAALAVASMNLKRTDQAAEYFKKVLPMLNQMSDNSRLFMLGTYYGAFLHNYPKAIETYRDLVSLYPNSAVGWNNLSIVLVYTLNIPEALSASRRALDASPRSLQYRLNHALYSMYAGQFQNAITEAQEILRGNDAYEFAYLPLALSTLASGDVQGARNAYSKLEKLSTYGFSLAKIGETDLEMYLGRYREALEPVVAGIAADIKEENMGELALKYVAQAEACLAIGQTAQAIEIASKAVSCSKADHVLLPSARVFIQAGEYAKAQQIAAELENMLQVQTRSYAKLIIGEIALSQKKYPEAVEPLQEAQKLHNSWLSHFLLGRTYLKAGHFAEALAEFEICQKRRGETADLFFADTATLRCLPPLYYWLALTQEGLGMNNSARDNYKEFLKLRSDADPDDPLVEDAKHRASSLASD